MSFTTWIRRFWGERRLYPTGRIDRLFFWLAITLTIFTFAILIWVPWNPYYAFFEVGGLCAVWFGTYLVQDPPNTSSQDEFKHYSAAIANMEEMGGKLSELVIFLKQERQKVTESEAVLRRLRDEKTQLEPVVLAERETVNAVLAAHARATASRAWKERLLGFITGLLASLLAAVIYEHLRR